MHTPARRLAQPLLVGMLLSFCVLCATRAVAHEYWIDPIRAQLGVGDTLLADIRNGEDFVGSSFPYQPDGYRRFYITVDGKREPVASRLGDYPAIHQEDRIAGLHTVVLETQGRSLEYESLARFKRFLAYHGLSSVAALHKQRRLPIVDIHERYYRFAKALVQVGDTPDDPQAGVAGPQGLLFELVALSNPYVSDELPLVLLFQGQRLVNAQIEVFYRSADDAVERSVYRTGADGVLNLPLNGTGEYLINAVQLIQPRFATTQSASGSAPHWESLWASMTFERGPGPDES